MPAKQVLIVEDERPIREMIAFGLKRSGFDVREAEDCRAARAALADRRPDLVLIDWMLPDNSGLALTRWLKRGGADAYMPKPFSPRELIARVNAVLRRRGGQDETEVIQVGDLSLDRAGH